MKEYLDKRKAAKQKPAAAVATATPARIAPTPAIVDPNSKLSYSCGHLAGVRQITDQECPECRTKRRVNRRKAQAKKQKVMTPDDSGRLPDGTTINGSYDAAKRLWNLQIITPFGVFDGEGTGIHRLMMQVGKRALEAANSR